jgi:HD-like signal output (HDOD) protein
MSPTVPDLRDAVFDSIKELPPLPMVVHQLMAVMQDAECSGEDINRILGSDQALASKVLRLVNSSFYGLPGRVGTIQRAVVILGHATLRSLATGLAVAGSLGNRLPPARRQQFWKHALASAAGAEVIARRARLPDPEEAFIAGLLHDIGHLILMMALPAQHAASHSQGLLGDLEAERAAMGIDHCRAGRQLLQHWKLPSALLECVRLHHASDTCRTGSSPLLTVVALADRISRVLGIPGESICVEHDIVRLADALQLSPEDVLELVPTIRDRMIEARSFLKMAEIEEDLTPRQADALQRSVVVVSEDPARFAWLTALAVHHGLAPRELRDWLVDTAASADTVILCDIDGITHEHAGRLQPLLARRQGLFYVISSFNHKTPADADTREALPLSMAFSAADLRLEQL